MIRLHRFALLLLAAGFLLSGPALAEPNNGLPPIDAKVKAEMKELYAKIKTDREIIKAEREKMKPIVERLKANNAKMRAMREKVKAQRDTFRAANPQAKSKKDSSGLGDADLLDDDFPPQ